eukprot:CAMPEP_0178380054 /NCGR_PEP_ID=MMETSP0689_2-20121128/5262_1 /TAXON_ID=160604 /ORGANISM="Amphidinium massartii, Strain CS-259" /LENGTH=345 /DNA_ID=CAMNT_0020000179 /DNA_START=104 /DNA_END=1143 /DNA_ORIENTATION=+
MFHRHLAGATAAVAASLALPQKCLGRREHHPAPAYSCASKKQAFSNWKVASCSSGSPSSPQPQSAGDWQDGLASQHLAIFSADGKRVSLSHVLAALADAEVVLLGETHDDPVAHQLELYLLVALQELNRSCTLSLEMFENDVQPVIDEYLAGAIREEDLLRDARPWGNYPSDYRLLMEFAKEREMPVLAANAPRRYVSTVGRLGLNALQVPGWPTAVYSLLPPLPLPKPTDIYMDHLTGSMAVPFRSDELGLDGGCPYMRKPKDLADAIVLWDCTMAHSKQGISMPNPSTSSIMSADASMSRGSWALGKCCAITAPAKGDFVILTDASLPRSHDYFSEGLSSEAA